MGNGGGGDRGFIRVGKKGKKNTIANLKAHKQSKSVNLIPKS